MDVQMDRWMGGEMHGWKVVGSVEWVGEWLGQ